VEGESTKEAGQRYLEGEGEHECCFERVEVVGVSEEPP